uniref:Uncharacterized protein n=1 Tax=Anguilla anguilla TaxID=7936 RepID=A0A0E9QAG8_ANGAN
MHLISDSAFRTDF